MRSGVPAGLWRRLTSGVLTLVVLALAARGDRVGPLPESAAARHARIQRAEALMKAAETERYHHPYLAPLLASRAADLNPSVAARRTLYELTADKRILRYLVEGAPVTGLALSNDGRVLASATANGGLHLWDVGTGRTLTEVRTGTAFVPRAVSFAAGGNLLATADTGGAVRIWRLADSGRTLAPTQSVRVLGAAALTFSPDGALLAVVTRSGDVEVVVSATGAVQLVRPTGLGPLAAVAFSRDGSRLAVGGLGGRIAVRDPRTFQVTNTYTATPAAPVYSLAYSPDDATLVAGYGDGTVGTWRLASGRLSGREPRLMAGLKLQGDLAYLSDQPTTVAFLGTGQLVWGHRASDVAEIATIHQWRAESLQAVAPDIQVEGTEIREDILAATASGGLVLQRRLVTLG